VAELSQLLYLLIHESAVSWSFRRGIHVGDTEDSHVSFPMAESRIGARDPC
jgi:hypothetical protein